MGTPLGGLLSGDSEGYGRRAQGTDITPWGSINRELREIVVRGLWRWGFSLYGSSVWGTWREGSFARVGYVEKALETGISFHRGPI